MTRSPVMNIVDPLIFCRDGTVWMTWRLRPLPYGYKSMPDKVAVRDQHTQLFRALRGEFLLQGVLAPRDPARIVDQMLEGVDLESSPAWAAECMETLDRLAAEPVDQRLFYLSVPLQVGGIAGMLAAAGRSAWTSLVDLTGLPRDGVNPALVRRLLARADELAKLIPLAFRPAPATAAEVIWLHRHAQTRGVFDGVPAPVDDPEISAELINRSAGTIGSAVLDEGARSDLAPRAVFNPLGRRYLKITSDTEEVAYQSLLMLSDTPAHGVAEIGNEFLGRIDDAGPRVDWAIRGRVRSQQEVLRRNKRAKNTLEEQVGQRDQDSAASSKLGRSLGQMHDYEALMVSDDQEVEVDAATIVICSGPTAKDANDDAAALQTHFRDGGFTLVRPPGSQIQAWWACLPGTALSQLHLVRERQLIAPAASAAVAMPLISSELGDKQGAMFALNITSPRPTPILLNITGNAEIDISGSAAVCGELGSGKSVAMKKLVGDTVDRGGRFVATDGSKTGEWAYFASSIAGAAVVDAVEPAIGLDPLRIFGPVIGAPITSAFLALLLDLDLREPEGQLLARVLKASYLSTHRIDSLGSLMAHLSTDCALAGAEDMAARMAVFADLENPAAGVARLVFDESLEPLDLTCRAIVFWTRGTSQPTREQLRNPHLSRNLGLDKLFGRALFGLIAHIAEQVCVDDPNDPAIFAVDETHSVTASAEGERVLENFVRQGRRGGAAVLLGSHDAEEDFGGTTLKGLIPVRIVLRHRDVTLAKRAIEWLGLDPSDEDLVKEITEYTSPVEDDDAHGHSGGGVREERRGEGIMRDSLNRFGRIKVLLPLVEERRITLLTTPTGHAA